MRAAAHPVLCLLALGAIATASGCGSASTTPTTHQSAAAASAAKATFVAQAQRICAQLSTQEAPLRARQEALKGAAANPSETTFVSLAKQVVRISREAAKRLRALPRPAADAQQIATTLNLYEAQITDVSDLALAVANRDSTTGEAADSALKRVASLNSVEARRFGIQGCAGSE